MRDEEKGDVWEGLPARTCLQGAVEFKVMLGVTAYGAVRRRGW